ncbi:MAG: class I poly(R)-hydroxyalkanoic acid synthase [Myxococcota bacterium]
MIEQTTLSAKHWQDLSLQAQKASLAFWKRAITTRPTLLDPLGLTAPMAKQTLELLTRPDKAMRRQMEFNASMFALWAQTSRRAFGLDHTPVIEPPSGDKRWRDPAWSKYALFDFMKQSYLLTSRWMMDAVHDTATLTDAERERLGFFTRQTLSALSPTNFIFTNPAVLKAIQDTRGANLLEGLHNLLRDLEEGDGELRTRMTDEDAFTVGQNVATAPGQVVFENDLMQLLQFNPTTDEVARRPLLIVPPWINKYYILDLQPKNSFIRWAVSQGHTVFVVSWINPDASLRHKGFADYMLDGPLAALDAIEQATGEREVNAIGYCIGGTLMAATLAYMKHKGMDDRIASITFFAAQTDFSEAGEIRAFINDRTLQYIDQQLAENGYLPARSMALSFNMLRENDLIWNYVVDQYLLGKQPTPFDLLYWNSDATRMPEAMHAFYLKRMYRDNALVEPGGVTLDGVSIDLREVTTPACFVATATDHIAPWKSSYKTTQLFQGPVTFILGGSGHIAGVINPPNRVKYQHWIQEGDQDNPADPEAWLTQATERPGSWWPSWQAWIEPFTQDKVPARTPGDGALKPLEPAPGRYVAMRADD